MGLGQLFRRKKIKKLDDVQFLFDHFESYFGLTFSPEILKEIKNEFDSDSINKPEGIEELISARRGTLLSKIEQSIESLENSPEVDSVNREKVLKDPIGYTSHVSQKIRFSGYRLTYESEEGKKIPIEFDIFYKLFFIPDKEASKKNSNYQARLGIKIRNAESFKLKPSELSKLYTFLDTRFSKILLGLYRTSTQLDTEENPVIKEKFYTSTISKETISDIEDSNLFDDPNFYRTQFLPVMQSMFQDHFQDIIQEDKTKGLEFKEEKFSSQRYSKHYFLFSIGGMYEELERRRVGFLMPTTTTDYKSALYTRLIQPFK